MDREAAVSILRGRRRMLACAATVALVAAVAGSASARGPDLPRNGRIVFSTAEAPEGGARILSAPLGAGDQRLLVRGLVHPVLAPSPDGKLIAFRREGRGNVSIWLMGADGGDQRRLVAGAFPTWSPDSRQLAFVNVDGGVMAIRRDGSGLRQVVRPESLVAPIPVWSPDGAWIAVQSGDDQLWVVRPNGTGLHDVARLDSTWPQGGGLAQATFSWSPNGRRLVYPANSPESRSADIFTVSVDGGTATRLTQTPEDEWTPQWSPDGRRIAFFRAGEGTAIVPADGSGPAQHVTRGAGPSWSPDSSRLAVVRLGHVWVARADGRAVRRVSRPERFSFALAIPGRLIWTPNGRRIIFPRESYFPGELMTVSPLGGRARRLTRNRIWETEPAWSPDGRRVAFTGVGLHDEQEIYVVRADGTQLRRLTRRPGPDSKPAWSPDGKRIVFVRESRDGAVLFIVPSAGGKPRPFHRLALRNGGSPSWAPASWIAINGIELISGRGLSRGRATRPPPKGFDLQPDWAPDGRRFAFVRQVAYDCRDCLVTYLMVGRVGNRTVRRIATDLIAPSWSPDGSRIAAVTLEGGGLVTVRPDGSGRRVLAVGLGESTEIDWGPAP